MSPTSGQALFGFFSRILATVAAVALSVVSWYIVVRHTAGVLVFLCISNVLLVSNGSKKKRIRLANLLAKSSVKAPQAFCYIRYRRRHP